MYVNAICFVEFFFPQRLYVMHLLFYMHFLVTTMSKRLEDKVSEVYGNYFTMWWFGVLSCSLVDRC